MPYPEPAAAVAAETDRQQVSGRRARVLESTPYGEIISAMSEAHGVDPLLVRALIQVESNYQARARSRKGAMGLMQLMPSTARVYKVRNPFDPRANIEAGIKHLKSLIDRFGRSSSAWRPTTPAKARSRSSTASRRTARRETTSSRILSLAGIK